MTTSVCSRCGAPLTASASGEYCPRCAGRLLLDAAQEDVSISQPSTLSSQPSSLRLGEYELGVELGRGAMGVVYRARQPRLKREVAVKVILASRFAGEAARKRFLAEAELAAQLDHPNIVPIYEVGETPDGPFYAMKLVEGGTLAANVEGGRLKVAGSSNQPLSTFNLQPRNTAALIAKISRAVHHAHQRGVLHRDLKPGNILIDAQGEPHVTDFGLARQLGVESSLTLSGSTLGTPAYMSPEQARGEKDVTTASDVWSLGAILYHLLAGRPPFRGDTAVEVLRKVMEEEPVPPSRLRSSRREQAHSENVEQNDQSLVTSAATKIDRDLETICLKCLEKDPARRYGSALALAEDLERWLNHEPIRARPTSPGGRLVKWARRNPARATLATALLVMSLVGLAGITSQWRRAERNAKAERISNQQAREQLWNSLLAQARAGRLSGQFGSKRAGLAAIAAAARIRSSPELRDEAIAHLALFDLQPDAHLNRQTNKLDNPTFDYDVERCANLDDRTGLLSVFRLSDETVFYRTRLPGGAINPRFSPQGRCLVVRNGDASFILDATTGREKFRLRNVQRLQISPDDAVLGVISTDRRIRFFNVENGQALPQELVRTATDDTIAWSPDGNSIVLTDGDVIEIWNWRRGVRSFRFQHGTTIGKTVWEGEYLAVGDERGGIRLWNSRTKESRLLLGHDNFIERLHLNQAGTLLASSSHDGTTRFWNTATGKLLLTTERGFAYQISREGSRVAYRTERGWGVWQSDASHEFRLISTGDQTVDSGSTADISPDNRSLLIGNGGAGIQLVDLASGRVSKLDARGVRAAWFLPDGKTIVSSGDNQSLLLWPLGSSVNERGEPAITVGAARPVPGGEWKGSHSAKLSDDGRLVGTKAGSREVVIVSLDQTGGVTRLLGESGACRPTLSADHRWVVTASESGGGPVLWEADTGHRVRALHKHPGKGGAQFSPDGRILVTSDPSGVRFYDVTTWSVIRHWAPELATPLAGCVAFTPDNRLVAVTSGKRELRLADPRTGEVLATLTSPEPRPINSLRFSRDGRLLAVATATDAVDLWDIALLDEKLKRLGLGLP